jgi:hypothetical protein
VELHKIDKDYPIETKFNSGVPLEDALKFHTVKFLLRVKIEIRTMICTEVNELKVSLN